VSEERKLVRFKLNSVEVVSRSFYRAMRKINNLLLLYLI
jgi:hypothetical protein